MDVDEGKGEADEGGIAARSLALAPDDPGEVFDPTKQVLDQVATLIGLSIVRDRPLTVALGGNDGLSTVLGTPVAQFVGVVSSIADEPLDYQALQERQGVGQSAACPGVSRKHKGRPSPR